MVKMPNKNDPDPTSEIKGRVLVAFALEKAIRYHAADNGITLTNSFVKATCDEMLKEMFYQLHTDAKTEGAPKIGVSYDEETDKFAIEPLNQYACDLFDKVGNDPSAIQ